MKCAIVIPARMASTRLPRKLVLAETGKALICHTVDAACSAMNMSSGRIARVIVAADDDEIIRLVNDYAKDNQIPVEAQMTRVDHASGSDRVAEVASRIKTEGFDSIINLQGDEPEMDARAVVSLLDMLGVDDADIATLGHQICSAEEFTNPNLVKIVLGENNSALYFSRAAVPFDRDNKRSDSKVKGIGHLGIYAYKLNALERFVSLPQGKLEQLECLEQLRALENGMRIVVSVLDKRPPKGIDTPEDYQAFVSRTN